MIKTQYRIYYFPAVDRYVGYAWSHANATIVTTRPQRRFSLAKQALQAECDILNVQLTWFADYLVHDPQTGEFEVCNDIPREPDTSDERDTLPASDYFQDETNANLR